MASSAQKFHSQYEVVHDGEAYPPGAFGRIVKCRRRGTIEPIFVVKQVSWQNARKHCSSRGHGRECPDKEMQAEVELMNLVRGNPLFCQFEAVFWTPRCRDDLYLVMERCDCDLYTIVIPQDPADPRRRQLYEEEGQVLIKRVLEALLFLHEQCQFIHRDLKLENIFLRDHRDVNTAILGDFGTTRRLEGAEAAYTMYIGTESFWPPEMFEGARYNTGVDVWQVGCMVYTIVTLTYPFGHGEGVAEAVRAPPVWGPQFENMPLCRDFIQSLLRIDPSERPTVRQALAHPWITTAIAH